MSTVLSLCPVGNSTPSSPSHRGYGMLQAPEGKQDTEVFPVRTYPGSQWYFTDMPGMNSVTPSLSCWPFLIIGGRGHGGTARRGKSPS